MEDEIVQYYVINSEVCMSPGKISIQVAHVASRSSLRYQSDSSFQGWVENYEKKILLRGKEKDLLKLVDLGCVFVRDEGFNEIPKGTLTCVCLPPMLKSDAKKYIKRLQLYK